MPYFVYMMASRKGGTIYTGVTNDLSRRAFEHREGSASKFTRKYKVRRLVWLRNMIPSEMPFSGKRISSDTTGSGR